MKTFAVKTYMGGQQRAEQFIEIKGDKPPVVRPLLRIEGGGMAFEVPLQGMAWSLVDPFQLLVTAEDITPPPEPEEPKFLSVYKDADGDYFLGDRPHPTKEHAEQAGKESAEKRPSVEFIKAIEV